MNPHTVLAVLVSLACLLFVTPGSSSSDPELYESSSRRHYSSSRVPSAQHGAGTRRSSSSRHHRRKHKTSQRHQISRSTCVGDPECNLPEQSSRLQEGVQYSSNSRVSSAHNRGGSRNHHRRNHQRTSQRQHHNQEQLTNIVPRESVNFPWSGGDYAVGGHRITTTKTTKTRKTAITPDGSVHVLPGSTHVTTIRNSTSFTSHLPGARGDHQQVRYVTSTSNHGSGRGQISSASSQSATYGEDYFGSGEEPVYDYEGEEIVDPDFVRGVQLSMEDQMHPFELRNSGSSAGYGRVSRSCERRSCYPATGNLLIGRQDRLTSTSTCGLRNREKFCIVSHLQNRKKCFWCDSRPEQRGKPRFSHTIDNIIDRLDLRTGQRSWWQSENGRQTASIQLNLEAEFHLTHLIITFRTFRPSAMLIERSFDFGKTWKVYKYFAYNCGESFPGVATGPRNNISSIVCESRYSSTEPSTEGEVIFRVMSPNIRITNPYSEEVQNLLKITNLRVNFTKLHTLGDQLLDTRPEIKEKYYYSIYEMVVRGSCSCYGHASRCLPLPGVPNRPHMVHGRCECTHNTIGLNCEKCQDFYHDLPWRPAVVTESNACKKCNCNNHSTRCYFDDKVHEETARVSGGVCQDCEHSTQGRNCQECVPYFYQEPGRDLRDPAICQPCNCDTRGSLNDGICESHSAEDQGLEAGRCHCKQNVGGLKCDSCKPGYWNYTVENPLGCQECTCNRLGTVDNQGCDVHTGECQCKRFVTGRDCNQCLPQHYDLSDHPDGCNPCDCDKGGALDNDCDVISGQCQCRPHVVGRRCHDPEEGFYVASLNYLTYEAELAIGSELYCSDSSLFGYSASSRKSCQVVLRERKKDGSTSSWTGLGFMRVVDGSKLEFEIENIETSMEYDMVLRYEPQFRGQWDNVEVFIERYEPVDPTGTCKNVRPINDQMVLSLRDGQRHETFFPPICLEAGKRYKVKVEFRRSNAQQDLPSASILIDSIMLIPRTEKLPFYTGTLENDNLRQEFEYYRCRDNFYTGEMSTVPELCREDHLDSIGFYVYGQAFACECDPTGAESTICKKLGGLCECKRNVAGRRCDRCQTGTYGLGPLGCTPCECNSVGSLDNFCNVHDGKCKCRPNTYGRQCDQCQPGYWNFPNCRRCECHGHADTCDPVSGACNECSSHTTGANCDTCVEGHYGDPRLQVGYACRPCMCPGKANTHSFATRCSLDPQSKDVRCECQEGYLGPQCRECSDNFYGQPDLMGGQCRPCDCNGNIDLSRPGNCNRKTGQCLACLFDTSGQNCGRCRPGYYGDALTRTCQTCHCDLLGSEHTDEVCDHLSGQCPCRANVLGQNCNKCAPNHWKIASGEGCEKCDCDPVGSLAEQCNEFDGQCQCREGFGGRRCNQCQTYFFGDPRRHCMPCNCNHEGSASHQCHPETGTCECKEGIGGDKCNRCARGYSGNAPYCQPCGECFDNWDFLLDQLKDRTATLIESAKQIRRSGATGAYKTEFNNMEDNLEYVREILQTANTTSQNLLELTDTIDMITADLDAQRSELSLLEDGVDNTTQRISFAMNSLATLRTQAETLRSEAADLKKKGTKLQEANVEGALNSTRNSNERSEAALARAIATHTLIEESRRHRRRTDNRILHSANSFNLTQTDNDDLLDDLSLRLSALNNSMPDINDLVCDGRGDPCDRLCGGAGCGRCGSLSCNEGLVEVSKLGLEISNDAETILRRKEASTDDLLRGITAVLRVSEEAARYSEIAYNASLILRNTTDVYVLAVEELLENITDYFDGPRDAIEAISRLSKQTQELNIKLRPEQITELSDDIRRTIESLTNIDNILHETSNNLTLATKLKERADNARKTAEDILNVAKRVVAALNSVNVAQRAAESAIDGATNDIDATQDDLEQIAEETQSAARRANASLLEVEQFDTRVKDMRNQYNINQRHLLDTKAAVLDANSKANKASNDAVGLEDRYNEVIVLLERKSSSADDARARADALKQKANKLAAETYAKLELLKELQMTFSTNEATIESYENELLIMEESMEVYHSFILRKAEFYATCTSGKKR